MNATTSWALLHPDPWRWALLVLLVVVVLAAVRWERRRRIQAAWPSGLLRLLLVAWVAAALLGVATQHELRRHRPTRVRILLDRTLSTRIAGIDPRITAVAERLVEALQHEDRVELLAYQGHAAASPWQPATATVQGVGPSLLLDDLELLEDPRTPTILLTDGLVPEVGHAGPVSHRVVAVLTPRHLEAPASAWLGTVAADAYALVRSPLRIRTVVWRAPGADVHALLEVREADRSLATTAIAFAPGQVSTTVALDVLPRREGTLVYELRLHLPDTAAHPGLTTRRVPVEVLRDRIRVLHVVGRPDWETRLVREILKAERTVDLVSFQILRTRSDRTFAREDELSLIPFPTQKLFTVELPKFDVVVFQNFDYRPYFAPTFARRLLANVQEFVEAGGGFVMTAGDLSFGAAGYQYTPLARILPVTWQGRGVWLPGGEVRGDTRWAEWFGAEPPSGAWLDRVYAAHPRRRSRVVWSRAGAPVVVLGRASRGHTAAILTDRLWRAVHMGGALGYRAIAEFWSRLIRYLAADPRFSDHHVEWAHQRLLPGERPRGRLVPAVDESYRLLDSTGRTVAAGGPGPELHLPPVTAPGVYHLAVSDGVAPEPLLVDYPPEELATWHLDVRAWRRWSERQGALWHDLTDDDLEPVLARLKRVTSIVVERRVEPVTASALYWWLGFLLLLGDLALRRWARLP